MGTLKKALVKSRQPLLVAWERGRKFKDVTVATYQDDNGVRVISNRTESPSSPIDGGRLTETASAVKILRAQDMSRLQLLGTCAHCEVDWRAPAEIAAACQGQSFNCEICGGDMVIATDDDDDASPGAGAGDPPPADTDDDEDEDTSDDADDDSDDDSDDSDDSDADDSDEDDEDDTTTASDDGDDDDDDDDTSDDSDDDSDDEDPDDDDETANTDEDDDSSDDSDDDSDSDDDETAADGDDSDSEDGDDTPDEDDYTADVSFDDEDDDKGGDVADPNNDAHPEGSQPSAGDKPDTAGADKTGEKSPADKSEGETAAAKPDHKTPKIAGISDENHNSLVAKFKSKKTPDLEIDHKLGKSKSADPAKAKMRAHYAKHELIRRGKLKVKAKPTATAKPAKTKKHTVHSATLAEVLAGLRASQLTALALPGRIVLLNGQDKVVARVVRDACVPAVQGMFDKPGTVIAALNAAAELETASLEPFGLELAAVEVDLDTVAQSEVASAVAGAEAEVAEARRTTAERVKQCYRTSMLGVAKGVWRNVNNPIREQLTASLQRLGVRNPEVLVDTALANSVEPFMLVVEAEAEKLAKKSNAARNEVATMIGDAKYIAAETASAGADDGLRFMTVHEPESKTAEVAASKSVPGQKFKHLF